MPTDQIRVSVGGNEPLNMTVISGKRSGPVAVILAGIHGDEEEGVISARRLVSELQALRVDGAVKIIPVANAGAYKAATRTNPEDGLNLARVFPGKENGSITERLAATIVEFGILGASVLIDLHSAGSQFSMPLLCGYMDGNGEVAQRSAKYAEAFGAPLVWRHTVVSAGRSLSAAHLHGVPAIYAECNGGGLVRGWDTDAYVSGCLNVLHQLKILPEYEPSARMAQKYVRDAVNSSGDIDRGFPCPVDGTFVSRVSAGNEVLSGTWLGDIYGDDGVIWQRIISPTSGVLMFLSRKGRCRAGEPLFIVAEWDG